MGQPTARDEIARRIDSKQTTENNPHVPPKFCFLLGNSRFLRIYGDLSGRAKEKRRRDAGATDDVVARVTAVDTERRTGISLR